MAAPSGTVWGSIVGGYGRVGIHVALTHTNTHTTRVITLWFWSKYGLSDSTNTLYYDAGTTNATSSKGSVSISTSVSSGSGWSTSNQVKLKTYSHTYARGTSDWGESCAMKLAGIDRVGGTMTATTKYTVPKLASYTVSYNANGGSGAPSAQTKYYGKNLTLSSTVPSKSGYTFLGWGTSSTSTSASYGSGATYSANAGITLYAIWRKTISIYYNANGNGASLGSITTQSVNVYNATTSASITLSNASGPSKSGYTFLGWSTNSGATSATYAKGVAYTFSSSVTLYAIWRKTITITYNANGGSYTGTTSVGYAYNNATSTNITITGTRPTKNGYTFLGWSTSPSATPSATNSFYNSSTPYTFSANTTLYAIWKKTITITYDSNGGIDTPTATSVDIYNNSTSADITLSSLTPTRIDYTFLGWSLYSDATTATYSSGAIATFTESKTLYAVWEVAYIKPTIYNVKVDRVDIDGNSADDGTFVAISMEVKATEQLQSVDFSYTINNITHTERPMIVVQAITDTSPVQNIIGWYTSVNKFILGRTLATEENQDIFSVEHDYTITITATDEVGNSTYDVVVDSINVQIDIGQDSVAIGKIAEGYKYFEVDYNSRFNKAVAIGGTVIENNFTSYLPVEFNENLTFATPKMIYGYNYSTGEKIECFCPQSAAGTTSMGYGGYVATTGQTKVFGNNIEMLSKGNITINEGVFYANKDAWLGGIYVRSTTSYIDFYPNASTRTGRLGYLGSDGANFFVTPEKGYLKLNGHTQTVGHHYFANGTTYYISNGGGARLASVTGVGTDNWLGKHRFCGEWIGMYNTANGGTRKGYIGHDGSTHLYIVNENGGSIYYNTGGNHYFNKGVLISAGNLGSSKAYNIENFSIYCKWRDSANHDIVTRGSDGLGCALGWAGSASYATIVTIRGRTCKYQNASGTTTLSDRNLKKDFESFSDAHDIFFDNLNPTTYKYILGSSGRSHFGYITQEVEEALESAGLTTKDFGGVNINKLSSRETETDDETGETKDVYNSATNYLLDKGIKEEHDLIYTEFISLNTWQIQKLKKRVNEQDEIIKSQNERISNLESEISELKSLIQQLLNK